MRFWLEYAKRTRAALKLTIAQILLRAKAQISGLALECKTGDKRLNFASSQAQNLPSLKFAMCKIVKTLTKFRLQGFWHYAPMFKEFEEAALAVQNLAT